jgi:hypothetical protein
MTWLLLPSAVAALLLLAVLAAWWEGRPRRALGEPRLLVDPGPYALGDVVHCRVSSRVRSRTPVVRATLGLTCVEDVEWTETESVPGDGTAPHSERTVTRRAAEEVWVRDQTFPVGRELRAGESLDLEASFELPPGGPASFSAPHNRILWRVGFVVSVEGQPDVVGGVGIEVTPVTRRAGARG